MPPHVTFLHVPVVISRRLLSPYSLYLCLVSPVGVSRSLAVSLGAHHPHPNPKLTVYLSQP